MAPLLRSGLATSQEVIYSHSPAKGSLWVRRQPSTRFLFSCSLYRVWSPAAGSGTFLSAGAFSSLQEVSEKMRIAGVRGVENKREQLNAQTKTAFLQFVTL